MLESFMILQALFDISTKKQGECLNKCKIVKKSEIRISVEILAVNDLKLKDKNRSDDVFALTYLKSKPESKLKIALQNGSGKDRVYL